MLRFQRYFSASRNLLKTVSKHELESYTSLLKQPYFHRISNHLNNKAQELEPYELSDEVTKAVRELKFNDQEASIVHNKLIEELTKHNFGIATIQSKILKELKQELTLDALLQIIKYNPGRIKSSWNLFIDNVKELKEVPDELLLEVLRKLVNFDSADVKDGKKAMTVNDITNASYILSKFQDRKLVDQGLIDKITRYILETDATDCLPTVLSYTPSFAIFETKFAELTPLQTYYIFNFYPFEILRSFKEYVYNLVMFTGRPSLLKRTEEEPHTEKSIKEQIEVIKKTVDENWDLQIHPVDNAIVEKNFFRILEDLKSGQKLENDFPLVKMVLRIFSLTRSNIEEFMDLYIRCSSNFPAKQDELVFEAYLAYCFKAFKTGDASFLQAAQNWLPKTYEQPSLKVNVLRVSIITEAKFNIEKSLQIFNDNIQDASKVKEESERGSQADLITESLILAYLYKQDIDFARMLLEKAMGEKLFSGKTAVRNIKKHLAGYGEAVENKTLTEYLDNDVCEYLQNL
ncbi:hypothetical protein C6P45_000808 [Maudiozyma exigua]|uniref:Uncharacterized protein n=1 Tax=Maudiozyma exigua TaxID=34358 RepID=A0A9P6WE38_MAUEX|nr:hypothetical protein C6P45_000808 [Kazachstania exigua]